LVPSRTQQGALVGARWRPPLRRRLPRARPARVAAAAARSRRQGAQDLPLLQQLPRGPGRAQRQAHAGPGAPAAPAGLTQPCASVGRVMSATSERVDAPPRAVLFLCVHNSARSQMAEAFARALAPDGVRVWSAGSERTRVHPLAIQVMLESGIDIGEQRSKTVDEVPWRDADTIVTLCAEADETCPTVPGIARRLHWPLPDPSAAEGPRAIEAFRAARDEIRRRVASLWPRGHRRSS